MSTEQEAKLNDVYAERDQLVAALSKVFRSFLARHPDEDKDWDDDWRWIVYVDLPTGQASWHIHDSELRLFDHLERRAGTDWWDGHTTEEKYERLRGLAEDWDGRRLLFADQTKQKELTVEDELKKALDGFEEAHCLVQFRNPVFLACPNPDFPGPKELWNVCPAFARVPQKNEQDEVVRNPITGEPMTVDQAFPPVPIMACRLRVKGQMLELEYVPKADGPPVRKLVHPGDVAGVDRVVGGDIVTP